MRQLIRAELQHILCTKFFVGVSAVLVVYNIWDILLTDFGFEVGWSFFLFQKTPLILISMAIITTLHIGRELRGKMVYHKMILGYHKRIIYKVYVLVGVIGVLSLLLIDTSSVILFSFIKKVARDIEILSLITNSMIIIVSAAVISIFITVLAIILPNRILSLFVVIGISLVLFQKGEELSIQLSEPEQTIFYNKAVGDAPIENPLYVKGNQRNMYNLGLLLSPYAQVQYEKLILFEGNEQKASTSLILENVPYHFEFILIGIIEIFLLYFAGRRAFLAYLK